MHGKVVLGAAVAMIVATSAPGADLPLPPELPDGAEFAVIPRDHLLKRPASIGDDIAVAETAPEVEFFYYPEQDHAGSPWSCWGDGSFAGGKYYSAIGDHQKPKGTALVYEFDPESREFRALVDLREYLESQHVLEPDENYTSGKIHTRVEMGRDGWLYYAGHRGSTRTTNNEHGFRGERVFRTHPSTGATEIVRQFPIPRHVIPTGFIDPERMIFYGGTTAGEDAPDQGEWFFALDLEKRGILITAPDGPKRCAILNETNGMVYWDGHRYDPSKVEITPAPQIPHIRSATRQTPDGSVFFTSEKSADIFRFDTKTEKVTKVGGAAAGKAGYTTTLDADPTGRYVYLIPGAHGDAVDDGTPVVQFDTETGKPKVVCFLAEALQKAVGYTPIGTFSAALSDDGKTLFITWNGFREGADSEWDVCALTVIRLP